MDNLALLVVALACPICMGAMMFFMMRPGAKRRHISAAQAPAGEEIARLRAEVTRLRTEQAHADQPADQPAGGADTA